MPAGVLRVGQRRAWRAEMERRQHGATGRNCGTQRVTSTPRAPGREPGPALDGGAQPTRPPITTANLAPGGSRHQRHPRAARGSCTRPKCKPRPSNASAYAKLKTARPETQEAKSQSHKLGKNTSNSPSSHPGAHKRLIVPTHPSTQTTMPQALGGGLLPWRLPSAPPGRRHPRETLPSGR